MALRDRWELFDQASLVLVCALLLFALFSRRLTYSRNLAASAIFLSSVFVLLPRIVFGSAYADMRLAPYLFAIALIAIRFSDRAGARFVALFGVAGLAFFLVRTGGDDGEHVALRPRLRPRAGGARPRSARAPGW